MARQTTIHSIPSAAIVLSLVVLWAGFSSLARADFEDIPARVEPTPLATPQSPGLTEPTPAQLPNSNPAPTGERFPDPATSGQLLQPPKTVIKPQPNSKQSGSESELQHNGSAPVSYSAQSLEGSLSEGRVLLKGDVSIEQADALMKSDAAEIFSAKGTTSPNRAVATGRVSLFKAATSQSAELRAVANELEYFMPVRKVLLKGKPKIWRGRELLQGEIIEVFLETNEIKVRGARGVMDPSAVASPVGNSGGSGVQASPAKKSSGQNRR